MLNLSVKCSPGDEIRLGDTAVFLKDLEFLIVHWKDRFLEAETQVSLSGRALNRRSGNLAKSYQWQLNRNSSGYTVSLLSSAPYAEIQDTGGTVSAAAGSWLTVPLPAAMLPNGVLIKKAREYTDAFIIRSKAGNLLIVEDNGAKGITPLFVLKKQITLKPTKWASDAVDRALPSLMEMIR